MFSLQHSLILLRGLPGSGKTTLAKLLSENGKHPIFSVDDYFTNTITGAYDFKFNENYLAYKQCETKCEHAMLVGIEKIILHNTFTIAWEIETYFKLAKSHNYSVFVVTVENYHSTKNTHCISDEQIEKMAQKYKVKLF